MIYRYYLAHHLYNFLFNQKNLKIRYNNLQFMTLKSN